MDAFAWTRVQAGIESDPVLIRRNGTASRTSASDHAGQLFHYVPDEPFGHSLTPVFPGAIDTSKHPSARQAGCRGQNRGATVHVPELLYRSLLTNSASSEKRDPKLLILRS